MRHLIVAVGFLALSLSSLTVSGEAQQPYAPQVVPAEEYARAEGFLGGALNSFVLGTGVRPNWLENGRFWYRNVFSEGAEFVMVDPERGTRERAFDHSRLARALSDVTGDSHEAFGLPFNSFSLNADGEGIRVDVEGTSYDCGIRAYTCQQVGTPRTRGAQAQGRGGGRGAPEVLSPDGAKAAFIRDHNLWVRDVMSNEETQLTTDGIEDFGYATNNAGWTKSDRPVLLWSPDSKMLTTFQHDGRGVGMMYLVSTKVGHPELQAWKYPMPEDSVIFRIHRVVIHLDGPQAPRVVRLDMPPDQQRSTVCDHIYCSGAFADIEWALDGSALAFVSSSRDHKDAWLRVANPETGEVTEVLHERVETFFECDLVLGADRLGAPLPVRPPDRSTEAPHNIRRLARAPASPYRSGKPDALLYGLRKGAR